MAEDMPMWKGLFEWSMKYQDGTHETSLPAGPMSANDRHWLENALKGAMVDLSKRMQDINETLAAPSNENRPDQAAFLADKERLLEELMEIVENIDQAKDLSTIGGLPTLVALLQCPHPSLQWRAAEVVATCAQNNPEVQDTFVSGGVLPVLWPLLDHAVTSCQIKGLLAVSCMVRGHPPSLAWFCQQGGAAKVVEMLAGPDARLQRKCLQMLDHLIAKAPAQAAAACGAAASPPLLTRLTQLVADGEDSDVRAAALRVVLRLAGDRGCGGAVRGEAALVASVEAVPCKLDALPEEEWGGAEEEAELAKQVLQVLAGAGEEAAGQQQQPASAAAAAAPGSMQMIMAPPQETFE